ncbi:MAG: tetratricopeptide repeat protein [Chitinispirillaceae bacterium]
MNIQQHKKKQEINKDPVLERIIKTKEYISKNSTAVIISVVAVIVVAVGAVLYYNAKESSIRNAQEIFGTAMIDYNANDLDKALKAFTEVANQYSKTPHGVMSAFMIGSIYMQQQNFDQAIDWFETAVQDRQMAGFVGAQALEGLAAAYEAKGDVSMAMDYLNKALADEKLRYRHPAVRWKLALLNQESNVELAEKMCEELISDTLATAYHQRAKNLIAVLNVAKADS